MTELPLIGLLNDVLLPGETRAFGPPTIDAGTREALASDPSAHGRLIALCVTSPAELPSLITARWATACRLVGVDAGAVMLAGERRVRVLSARGAQSPFSAIAEEAAPDDAFDELVREAHRLVAALGVSTPAAASTEGVRSAVLELVRALRTVPQLRQSLERPVAETVRAAAEELASGAQGAHAECELEASLRQLADSPALTRAARRRLWAQVVSVQRRLDVHDPNLADTDSDEIAELQRQLAKAGLPKAARVVAKRGLRALRGMATTHHDYAVKIGHLRFMAQLPWRPAEPPPLRIDRVERELGRDHTGLDAPKKRILEYFAVRTLGGSESSAVLCFAGPPGVGKTSIARAVARALDRPFVRVALGGVHDECEIRGHRLSFVAAAPGRILKAIADAAHLSEDGRPPVVLLDEIDKVSTARDRSPAAALLEVLDPEQNAQFRDNYLGVPFDLSPVLFICTANDLDAIPATLRDRLETIELAGYSVREKCDIARQHLIARVAADCALPSPPELSDEVLELMIEGYTREAGVRQLGRNLASVFRARALELLRRQHVDAGAPDGAGAGAADGAGAANANASPGQADGGGGGDASGGGGGASGGGSLAPRVDVAEVVRVLGPRRYRDNRQPDALPVGVATGLSVSPHGGATLFIEVARMAGKGELRLTGRLGDVMRESAHAALARLRMAPERHGVDADALRADFHVHVPEAATAKDGPSAGIALFAAFLSAARGLPLRADVAMTGEITLSGKVLAVGGVRQKLLAAERAAIRKVVLPELNRGDVPDDLRRELALEIALVDDLDDVVAAVFEPPLGAAREPSLAGGAAARAEAGSRLEVGS